MLGLTVLALLLPSAHAQEWECFGPLTHDEWGAVMDEVDASFRAFDIPEAKARAFEVQDRIRCLDAIVLPSYLGRYARQMSLIAFFEQDEIGAVRWGLLQRYAAEELPWPPDLGLDHPARNVLSFVDEPPLSGAENQGLAFPKKGAVFMNGELLIRPLARAEVPHLIQVTDRKGEIVLQYWQDGGAFREAVLSDDPASIPTAPKWFEPEDRTVWHAGPPLFESDVLESPDALAQAPTPEETTATAASEETAPSPGSETTEASAEVGDSKTSEASQTADATIAGTASPQTAADPLPTHPTTVPVDSSARQTRGSGPRLAMLVTAGGLGVASGALYTTGYLSRSGLETATNTDDLAAARSRVNILAASAGVIGLSAIGVGVTAFVDGNAAGLTVRF